MEIGKQSRREMEITKLYINYWKTHIRPLEDKRRVVQFERLLSEVALELYGPQAALELAVRFLLEDRNLSTATVSDI